MPLSEYYDRPRRSGRLRVGRQVAEVTVDERRPGSRRGPIRHFSAKAYQRMCAFVAAVEPPGGRQPRLLTLTFPGPEVPPDHKRRLNRFLYQVEGAYVWRADISTRLRLHYHVLYWGPEQADALARLWLRIVGPHPRAFRATGPAKHKRKYFLRKRFFQKPELSPEEEEQLTDIGRYWGHSQDLKPKAKQKLEISHAEAQFIRRLLRKWGRLPEEVEAGSCWIFCDGPEDAKALFTALAAALDAIRSGKHCFPKAPPRPPSSTKEQISSKVV